ncbi:hypothetical protein B0G75_12441 [Paraburkholderia sp. BL18I3N2]|nr:hypothetical protein B0G75_12441 [Paraburkholderia sp. BL18I3N2]PRX95976.1 hypothetical protein B0G73_13185 [Paraburkholderia sp. BL25I1N1]TDY15701.1 hypothetical protein B0G81_8794 [Paraburkholderia sp. BL6665CI2N2]
MTNDKPSTVARLTDLLQALHRCQEVIQSGSLATDGAQKSSMLSRIDELAREAHSLWPQGTEDADPEFLEIMRVKQAIQNLVVNCRASLAS